MASRKTRRGGNPNARVAREQATAGRKAKAAMAKVPKVNRPAVLDNVLKGMSISAKAKKRSERR